MQRKCDVPTFSDDGVLLWIGLIAAGGRLSVSVAKGERFHFGYMCQRMLVDKVWIPKR